MPPAHVSMSINYADTLGTFAGASDYPPDFWTRFQHSGVRSSLTITKRKINPLPAGYLVGILLVIQTRFFWNSALCSAEVDNRSVLTDSRPVSSAGRQFYAVASLQLDLFTIYSHSETALHDPTHLVFIVGVLGIKFSRSIAPCVAPQALVRYQVPDSLKTGCSLVLLPT